jgi:hypothetical protein
VHQQSQRSIHYYCAFYQPVEKRAAEAQHQQQQVKGLSCKSTKNDKGQSVVVQVKQLLTELEKRYLEEVCPYLKPTMSLTILF